MNLLKRAEKDGRRFLNPVPTEIGGLKLALRVLPQYLRNREETEPKKPLGPFVTDAGVYAQPPQSGLRVTWFGHSASLIEVDGARVLVDPVWDRRASPSQWMGPKRFFAPTMRLEDLPRMDAVLISHDHYDHLGAGTVKQLARLPVTAGARWVTSLGVAKGLRRLGVSGAQIVELDWTEGVEVPGTDLRITAWPARHFSGRTLWDRFTTLWSSFVVEGPQHRVYYGADSGWWEGLAEIAAQYDGFDLTMLEIGAFHPLWRDIHLGPEAALRAFEAMGGQAKAGLLMPVHWGLFNLALHAWSAPIEELVKMAEGAGVPLWSPEPGRPAEVRRGEELRSSWWQAAAGDERG